MLYKEPFIISPDTFWLIQQLQSLPELKDFFLVGGTALALQLGYRNSIDLFTNNEFSIEGINELLKDKFAYITTFSGKNTLLAVVDDVRTDSIKHDYPLIFPPITEDRITFLSKEDIAAMKFHAIVQSGRRLKDL